MVAQKYLDINFGILKHFGNLPVCALTFFKIESINFFEGFFSLIFGISDSKQNKRSNLPCTGRTLKLALGFSLSSVELFLVKQ